jgi:hypothetical protein
MGNFRGRDHRASYTRPTRCLEEALAKLSVLPQPIARMPVLSPSVATPFLIIGPAVDLPAVVLDAL